MYLLHVNQGLKYGEQSGSTKEAPDLSFLSIISVVTRLHRQKKRVPALTQTHPLPGATACSLSCEGLLHSCILCLSFSSLCLFMHHWILVTKFLMQHVCPCLLINLTFFHFLAYLEWIRKDLQLKEPPLWFWLYWVFHIWQGIKRRNRV